MLPAIVLILTGCNLKGLSPGYESITFKPTQCANPWDDLLSSYYREPEVKFQSYLKENGISEIYDFKIKSDNKSYCEACTCVGPETYVFKIKKNEVKILKSIEPFNRLDI